MTGEELPRLAGLEGFELWDRTVHAPEHKEVKVAFVSIRVGGVIGLNRAAFKMWGEPEACQVMYDPERRRIALKPADPKEENRGGSHEMGNIVRLEPIFGLNKRFLCLPKRRWAGEIHDRWSRPSNS